MELQDVIDYARNEHKSDLAKQIAEKLVLLGAENIKYVKEGKYSFNHGMNVGQCKALSWVLDQVKESTETQHVDETCKESDNSLTQEDAITIRKEWFEHCKKSWYNEGYIDGKYNRDRQFEDSISEDLEEEIKRYLHKVYGRDTTVSDVARHFAQWQKEQMMANAIDAHCFGFQGDALFSFTLPADNYLVGSQVKVIVIK